MIVTAGCGISQQSFPHWPTWVKYVGVTHKVKHKNIGGPAAGNEFIGESIIHSLHHDSVEALIVTWTSINKVDFYIEQPELAETICNYPSRNWLIDINGKIQNTVPNWWPSSVTNDNTPKKIYNRHFYSKTQQKNRLLTYIKLVQEICKTKDIPCLMYFSYNCGCSDQDFKKYHIDLENFGTLEPLADNFYNSKWSAFLSDKKFGLVPVAGWHWDFYKNSIVKFLNSHFPSRSNVDYSVLENYANKKTIECYQNNIS